MNSLEQKKDAFVRMLTIMDELRAQCPWDKKQTLESLRHLTIEEMYELGDAILDKNMVGIKKELGDVLLHIIFYSKIGSETGDFDIADVINSECDKLVSRHPHIYGDVKVNNEQDVKENWEKIKLKEKDSITSDGFRSVLNGVPLSLPAVVKSWRIQEKARAAGFDWEKPEEVWGKVEEEIGELHYEVKNNSPKEKIEDEFGDVLFALINYARFINVNPEDALERTNKKFIRRFQYLEKESQKDGKKLENMSLTEMDVYWNRAKAEERK
ncbi:MAG: nucleoside triphosphate pyrophosphohydrolase [Bacteroidetes bacterium]|jgi:XTP/dITP diphosphohydrolase|nr:nucleoside triphosphate pyrophosphohydrolase [Bacteroidota bacterium]